MQSRDLRQDLPLAPSSSQTSAALAAQGISRMESALLMRAPRRPSSRRAPAVTSAPERSTAMEKAFLERAGTVTAGR